MSGWVGHASLTCLRGHVPDVAQAAGTKRLLGTPVVPFLSFHFEGLLFKAEHQENCIMLKGLLVNLDS